MLLITRLSFDTDMLNLLPRKNPVVSAYIETLQDFGSQSFLLVTVDIPEGAVLDPYETLADDLAGRLAKVPELRNVQHRIGDPVDLCRPSSPSRSCSSTRKGGSAWPPSSATTPSAGG